MQKGRGVVSRCFYRYANQQNIFFNEGQRGEQHNYKYEEYHSEQSLTKVSMQPTA